MFGLQFRTTTSREMKLGAANTFSLGRTARFNAVRLEREIIANIDKLGEAK